MRRLDFPLPPIVGITGPAGSGKDTAALALKLMLQADGLRAYIYGFVYPLKRAVGALVEEDAFTDAFKTQRFGTMTGREIFQHVGTEGLRAFDPAFFVRLMERHLARAWRADMVIIPDLRFANEAEMVRRWGGLVVATSRPGYTDTPAHASEAGGFAVDAHLDNTGPVASLAGAWLELLTPVRTGALPPWGGAA